MSDVIMQTIDETLTSLTAHEINRKLDLTFSPTEKKIKSILSSIQMNTTSIENGNIIVGYSVKFSIQTVKGVTSKKILNIINTEFPDMLQSKISVKIVNENNGVINFTMDMELNLDNWLTKIYVVKKK